MKPNVIAFKTAMLAEQTKHIELKRVANMSSNDAKYNASKTSIAKYEMIDSTHNMHEINLAYYIVKHNLSSAEAESYLSSIHYKNAWHNLQSIKQLVDLYSYEKETVCPSQQ